MQNFLRKNKKSQKNMNLLTTYTKKGLGKKNASILSTSSRPAEYASVS